VTLFLLECRYRLLRSDDPHRFQEHELVASLSRNRILNTSFIVSSLGQAIILGIVIGIIKALGADKSIENNTRSFSIVIAFFGGVAGMLDDL
jgi:ABC-type dipeptide/oligopeptide/nickel transport system permease component